MASDHDQAELLLLPQTEKCALPPRSNQKPATSSSKSTRSVGALIVAILLSTWLLYGACCHVRHSFLSLHTDSRSSSSSDDIPNQVHFVKLLDNAGSPSEFSLAFTDFLAVYAAWHTWRPRRIYLHTNAVGAVVSGARDGQSGRWTQLVLQMAGVSLLRVPTPSQADDGVAIASLRHKTEFVAVEALRNLGGVYMAFDVFALHGDIRRRGPRRHRHHGIVSTRLDDMPRGRHFLMAARHSSSFDVFADEMSARYSPEMESPIDSTLAQLHAAGSLVTDESIIPSPDFVSHNLFLNTLVPQQRWQQQTRRRPCRHHHHHHHHHHHDHDINYSRTLPLQLTHLQITPSHLLERRSNFARAMYPVTRELLEKGLIYIGKER